VLELVEENLGHHTNTCSKIKECIVEVLISNGALYSGASWILFLMSDVFKIAALHSSVNLVTS
jgi:hypothetical protein